MKDWLKEPPEGTWQDWTLMVLCAIFLVLFLFFVEDFAKWVAS